jgi:hypothetical protein
MCKMCKFELFAGPHEQRGEVHEERDEPPGPGDGQDQGAHQRSSTNPAHCLFKSVLSAT